MSSVSEATAGHAARAAENLAEIRPGLLHVGHQRDRVPEPQPILVFEVRTHMSAEVTTIVDGVTKIGQVKFSSHTEKQVENYRKLLLSVAQDARVILVKLADRLHNMRTLEHLPPDKQRRVAQETREIYAPLAHRLGMAEMKWELEDLAFKFLEPEAYLAEIIRIMPLWPRDRYIELAPRYWAATRARLSVDELAVEVGPITVPAPPPAPEEKPSAH